MIQFNLLPDVKQEYLKAKRSRQLVASVSVVLSAASLAVLVLLFISVKVVQHKSMSDVDKDISAYSSQLKAIPNIDKILTVQNQLNALNGTSSTPGLHDGKVVSSRLFSYLAQLTPGTVSISDITTDFTTNTMTITGQASALDQVNVYADTLKETTYSVGNAKPTSSDPAAFNNVVLADFDRNDKGATYKLTLAFKSDIFSTTNSAALTVPNIVTSPQQQLFQKKADK